MNRMNRKTSGAGPALRKAGTAIVGLTLAICALLSFAGCEFAVPISAEELSAPYKRTLAKQNEIDETFLAHAADFSLALAQQALQGEGGSVSPISALYCLGLMLQGCSGKTLEQAQQALGMDKTTLSLGMQAFTDALYSGKDCEVRADNSLWICNDPELTVNESFLQNNAEYFAAQIYRCAFDRDAQNDMNAWVRRNTKGSIPKIVDRFDPDDRMYLINTLLFDAKWEKAYENDDVRDAVFYNGDGSQTPVKMLWSGEYDVLSTSGAEGFLKYYKTKKENGASVVRYAFAGLLPQEGQSVYDLLNELSGQEWLSMIRNRSRENIRVGIPEFSSIADLSLKQILSEMGMSGLFDENADLSALGSHPQGLYFADMLQKVRVDVDRNGTKAAAVSFAVTRVKNAEPVERSIVLDRPFLYAVVDMETGLPLFIGVQTQA